ncbi:MAG: MarR family transcriptional regulator [Lacipirellulaceae bacterium]|uniref:MarR family winged helix-turn-helix transcriptional regulator n=1 Tax=Marinobacter salarius TaxID=1420917 RepID=UPI0032F08C94
MAPKQQTFATGFLVHDVSRIRKKVVDQAVKPLGITRSQFWLLVNTARYGNEGIAQTELARLMSVGKVSLGGLIDRMEANGILERLPDPVDRRAKKVFMTRKGEELLHDLQEVAFDINKQIMKGISKEQNKMLDGMLRTMKRNLLQMDGAQD